MADTPICFSRSIQSLGYLVFWATADLHGACEQLLAEVCFPFVLGNRRKDSVIDFDESVAAEGAKPGLELRRTQH